MAIVPKIYSDEFERDAVEMVAASSSQKKVCRDLDISKTALQTWVRDDRFRSCGMAAAGAPVRVPVAVANRVLGFTDQAYFQWVKQPVSAREAEEAHLIGVLRELHEDNPEGGYRDLSDDVTDIGYQLSERRVWRLCHVAGIRATITTCKRRYR